VLTDNDSTDSDDDLSQDRDADFDNADDLLMKVVNQDNTDQFIKEQRDDLSLKPFWDMAEKHIVKTYMSKMACCITKKM